MLHYDKKLYLVFEYLEQDLKKYMDSAPPEGIPTKLVKVWWLLVYACRYVYIYMLYNRLVMILFVCKNALDWLEERSRKMYGVGSK